MKKLFSLIFIAMFVLIGCSSEKEASTNGISVGIWEVNEGEKEAFDQIMSEFETKTGIPVELRVYTDYDKQLTTELYGGSGPDVFMVNGTDAQNYIDQGALLALDEHVTQAEKDDFYGAMLPTYTREDVLYALPKDWSPLAIYCNEEIFGQTSYTCSDIPTDLESWPKFLGELQKQLSEGQYASSLNPNLHLLGPWLEVDGVNIIDKEGKVDLTNPEILENSKIVEELLSSPGFFEVTEVGYASDTDAFISGDSAIMISGAWNVGVLADTDIKYSVKEMPTYKGEKNGSQYTVGWGVNANSKNIDAGVEMVKFAADRGAEIFCTNVGSLPARETVAKRVGTKDTIHGSAMLPMAEYAKTVQYGTVTTPLVNEFKNTMESVKSGAMTMEEGFKQIEERINSNLENFNE